VNAKEIVREQYGAVARGGGSCCSRAGDAALAMGYRPEDLAGLPEGANLALGCGNPTALAALLTGGTALQVLPLYLVAPPTGAVLASFCSELFRDGTLHA
jgi:hypothetical protein